MPSFDVVCEADMVEVKNAVEQSNKEITTRFDFKGSSAKVEQKENELTAFADSDFQLSQVQDILTAKLVKRNVDVRFLDIGKIEKIGPSAVIEKDVGDEEIVDAIKLLARTEGIFTEPAGGATLASAISARGAAAMPAPSSPKTRSSWSQRQALAMRAAHAMASSREGSSNTVKPPLSVGAQG